MLLNSKEFLNYFKQLLSQSKSSFLACSAFVKASALQDQIFRSALNNKEVKIVARWQKRDLLARASDLEVYEFCKQMGWKFGVCPKLHAKIYLFDETTIMLGSANLTQSGLNLHDVGNFEYGTTFTCSKQDIEKINEFIDSETIWMNDKLFSSMKEELENHPKDTFINDAEWSPQIQQVINAPVKFLLLSELLNNPPTGLLAPNLDDLSVRSDMSLLGIGLDDLTPHNLRRSFRALRLHSWLISELSKSDGLLTFGALSSILHNSVLNEPRPYRVEIKKYVGNIFRWAALDPDSFEVSKPRHTEILTLKQQITP